MEWIKVKEPKATFISPGLEAVVKVYAPLESDSSPVLPKFVETVVRSVGRDMAVL
jgi:hypothetical protein